MGYPKLSWETKPSETGASKFPKLSWETEQTSQQQQIPAYQSITKQRSLLPDEIQPTQTPEEQQWYKDHPVLDKLAHNPVSKFWDTKIAPFFDVLGNKYREVGFGDTSPVEGRVNTTGNKTADFAANAIGTIGAFTKAGTGGVGFGGPVNEASKALTNKIIPVTNNLLQKVGKRAVQGAIESVPYSAQQVVTQPDINSPGAFLRATAGNALLGVGAELGLMGLSGIAKTVFSKLKSGQTLTEVEKEVVNNTPELRALPEARPYLLLPERATSKIPLPESTYKPIVPETPKPDFYATQGGTVVRDIGDFSRNTSPKLLPAGNPAPQKTTGQAMIDLSRRSVGLPVYSDNIGTRNNIELPFVANKKEVKGLGNTSLTRLSKLQKEAAKRDALIKSGEHSNIGQRYDFINSPAAYFNKSIYDNAVGMREQPLKAYPGELRRNTEPIKPQGNINSLPTENIGVNGAQSGTDTRRYIASKTVRQSQGNLAKKTYTATIDDLYPISKVSKDAYTKAMNSRQADMVAHRSLTVKLVDKTGKVVNESLKDITTQIPKGLETDFTDYMINRHAPSWMEQGRKVFPDEANMTADASRAKVAQYETVHPEFKQLGDRVVKYQQALAKTWLVDSGIMKPETWEGLLKQYPDYVPFQREFSQIEKGGGIYAKRGFVNQSNPIKKATGSQRKIIDPIETIIERTGQYIKTAKRNEVGQSILSEVRQNPEAYKGIIEIIPPKSATASSDLINNVNEVLQRDGIDGLVDKFNQPWERQQFFANQGGAIEKGQNIVTVLENGAPVHLKVNDPDLLKALSNLNPQQATAITRAVGKVTGMMKTLTTGINPVFGLARNVWRDLATGYINSKTINANPLGYAQYIWDLTKAIGNTIAEPLGRSNVMPESVRELFSRGGQPMAYFKNIGGGGHVSAISGDRNLLAKAKADILPKSGLQRATSIPGKLYRGIENLNNTLEVAPRLAEAKRVLKKGGTTDEALFESQDLTVNFSKKGNVTKEADAFIPYLNAAVQGLDKVIRVYNPASSSGKNVINSIVKSVYAVTVPALVLYTLNHDDPNYQQLSDYQKDNYFNIPNDDGTFTKIPKPREQGVVFGAFPERMLRAYKDNDPQAFKQFADTVRQNFVPPTEWVGQSAYNIWSTPEGRDWKGNPIVNQGMLDVSPRYQYDENTSQPAKAVGNLLNISPKKIDATAKAYLGGVAQIGIPATTKGKNVLDTLKSQLTVDPLYSNDILNDFYNRLNELTTKASNRNLLENIPSKFVTKEERIKNAMAKVGMQISALNKQKKQAQAQGDKATVTALQKQILDLARNALEQFK